MKVHYCVHCGILFEARRDTARFCSTKHRVAFSRHQEAVIPDYRESLEHSMMVLCANYPLLKTNFALLRREYGQGAVDGAIVAIRAIFAAEANR